MTAAIIHQYHFQRRKLYVCWCSPNRMCCYLMLLIAWVKQMAQTVAFICNCISGWACSWLWPCFLPVGHWHYASAFAILLGEERFPTTKRRRITFGNRIRRKQSTVEEIYCRMINDPNQPMIVCSNCRVYYHMHCEGVNSDGSYKGKKWFCCSCENERTLLNLHWCINFERLYLFCWWW